MQAIAQHAEECAGCEDEDKPVLCLVDFVVVLGHSDDAPVVEPPGDEQREDGPVGVQPPVRTDQQ